MFFQTILVLIIIFFAAIVLTPVYIKFFEESLFQKWAERWKNEVEHEKRKLAMQEGKNLGKNKAKVGRKQTI